MNNIDIEKMKREIKVKVGATAVFCGLLFTLMGCGKTVVDTTVEQQPTQTIETTVDDPVVDVPVVEPTADVSDNTTVEPEEDEFADATLVQTGDSNYVLYTDCPDNSNAPEIEQTVSICYNDTWSETYGVSSNLVNAVLTHGVQVDPLNAAQLNYDLYRGTTIRIDNEFGVHDYITILGDTTSSYSGLDRYVNLDELTYKEDQYIPAHVCMACAAVLKDSIRNTDGNIELALIRYQVGDDAFEELMQECIDATGLTRELICKNYGADFVYQYDTLGIGDPNYVNDVLQYVSGDIVITEYGERGSVLSVATYTVDRAKTYGSR